MAGGGGLKKTVINTILEKPVQVYLVGGAVLYGLRSYQTQVQFNYWFGKNEFDRRFASTKLWKRSQWFQEINEYWCCDALDDILHT